MKSNVIVKRSATTLDTIVLEAKKQFIAPAPIFKSVPQTTEVGITNGELNVSLSGGATYSIPIAVPPGINGVIPKISLTYNSQRGNVTAGYGWNINGLSTISKIASTKVHDNLIDPVDFDILDRYAFDGQRLMLKTGTIYGASGNVYETESFSTVKITSIGTHPNGANFGPASFLVEYPDGSIASYATVTPTNWAITYWQNAQGLRISYFYTLTDNVLTINKITYSATYSNTGINEINFDYGTTSRLRPEEKYIGGLLFKESKLLQNINVNGNGINFKNYVLGYNVTTTNYQRLGSVIEKCGDSSLSLNPTTFSYTDSPEIISYNNSTATGLPFTGLELRNSATISGDYNGDSKMDFLIYPTLDTDPDKNKRVTVITNIDGAAPNFGTTLNLTTPFINIFPTKFRTFQNKLSIQNGFTTVDRGAVTSFGTLIFTNYYYSSGPVGVYQQNSKSINFGQNYLSYKLFDGDFNWDGLTDVVCLSPDGNYFVNLDMNDSVSKYLSPITANISTATNIKTGDVNGDGKTDLMIFQNQQLKVYSVNENNQLVEIISFTDANIILTTQILIGDLNGDGKADFTIPNAYNSTTWYSYVSTGTSFFKSIKTSCSIKDSTVSASYNYTNILQDFDNDGKADLIIMTGFGANTTVNGAVSIEFYKNINGFFTTNAGLASYYASSGSIIGMDRWAIPIFYNSNQDNQKLELGFIRNDKIHFFQSQKDFNEAQNSQLKF